MKFVLKHLPIVLVVSQSTKLPVSWINIYDGVQTLDENSWFAVFVFDSRFAEQLEGSLIFAANSLARIEAVHKKSGATLPIVVQTMEHLNRKGSVYIEEYLGILMDLSSPEFQQESPDM